MRTLVRSALLLLVCGAGIPLLRAQGTEAEMFERASQALRAGEYPEAEKGFERVLAMDPQSVASLGNLGVIYARTHRFARALDMYQKGLQVEPGNESLTLNLGLAYLKQEDYARAKPYFQTLVSRHPEDGRFRTLLATSMILGDAPQAGLDLLRGSQHQEESDSSKLYLLAVAYARTGQMEAGKRIFSKLLAGAETRPQANFLLGQAFYDGQRFAEAEAAFREVLRESPEYAGVHRELGKIYISMHRDAEAERELREAAGRDAKDSGAVYFLGALLVQTGRYAEGIAYLEKGEEGMPDSWAIPFYVGKARLKMGEAAAAVTELRKAAALNTDEPQVFYLLANALRLTGHPERAKVAMHRVAELHASALDAEKAGLQSKIAGSR